MVRTRRTESQAVRREQLLAAARKVFRNKGYDNATISDIVRAAGVAQGTFYLYFTSKKDAALALAQQLLGIMAKSLQGAYDPALSFEGRLQAMIKRAFRSARQNTDLCRLTFIGVESMLTRLHSASVEHAVILGDLTRMLQQAIEAGEMEPMDLEITARLVMVMVQNAIIEAFVFGDGSDAHRLEDGVTKMLVNALTRRR